MATQPTLINSVTRALHLLDAVGAAELPQPAKKLARATGIPLPTTYHLLRTLVHEGYLHRTPEGYVLGDRVDALGRGAQTRRVRQVLHRLHEHLRAATYLAALDDGEIVLTEIVDSPATPRTDLWVGFHDAAHATALGKAVLAALPEEARREYVAAHPLVELFANPQHEYTRSLLGAVPKLGAHTREVAPVAAAGDAGSAEPVVRARDLEIVYPGRLRQPGFRAVGGVSLEIAPGEVLGLVGESGSGKTTIGRAIAGLTRATGGSLQVLGHEMVGFKERSFRPLRARLGFVFQDPATSFNPLLTVGEAIAEPLLIHERARDAAAARPRVHELLDAVHLPTYYAERYPHELSGGQRQRASLARALALDPDLLIADEPTSALDVSVQARVLEVFSELQERLGSATLFISHDLAVVGMLADRIAVLYRGELVELGTGDQVLHAPEHEYTRRLLASVPVPDPVEQERRRKALAALRK